MARARGRRIVQVVGGPRLAAQLRRRNSDIQKEARAATRNSGRAVEELTAFLVPKRTWLMHDSISLSFDHGGLSFMVKFDKAAFDREQEPYYPVYVELGTQRQRAQPSLGPAYFNEIGPYEQAIKDILRRHT